MFTKRINNDFDIMLSVYENNIWIDLSKVEILRIVLTNCLMQKVLKEEIDYSIVGGILKIHVTSALAPNSDVYSAIVSYRTPDDSADGYRDCEFDTRLFAIVPNTKLEDAGDYSVDVNITAAMTGDSAYEIWLSEGNVGTVDNFMTWLQKPASDAAQTLNEVIEVVNQATQEAKDATELANQAALNWEKNW